MADLNTFKNYSNFTDDKPTVVAIVRGVSAAVCCIVLSIVLVALVILAILPKSRKRLCGTLIKRLTFGTIAVSVAYQLNFAPHLLCTITTEITDIAKQMDFSISTLGLFSCFFMLERANCLL